MKWDEGMVATGEWNNIDFCWSLVYGMCVCLQILFYKLTSAPESRNHMLTLQW